VGSTYVQTERITALSVGAGVALGFLSCALLVVNNLRDIPTDTVAGKRTLAVRLGDPATRWLYTGLVVGAFVAGSLCGLSRWGAVACLLAVPAAWPCVRRVLACARGRDLVAVLVGTGRLQLVFGACFALGVWLTA
jgi:1,4-dihydroxy-2-naphthoate octaprenyltransferase